MLLIIWAKNGNFFQKCTQSPYFDPNSLDYMHSDDYDEDHDNSPHTHVIMIISHTHHFMVILHSHTK